MERAVEEYRLNKLAMEIQMFEATSRKITTSTDVLAIKRFPHCKEPEATLANIPINQEINASASSLERL